jgi:hypothetical protein
MTGCKENACATCIHQGVCVYKDNFLSACNAVGDVTVYLESNRMIRLRDIQWIEPVDLRCKHYYKEKEVTLR